MNVPLSNQFIIHHSAFIIPKNPEASDCSEASGTLARGGESPPAGIAGLH